jgi:hypothetical protein
LNQGNTVQAEIGDDDTFKLEKVQPGRYRVELSVGSGAYVKSLRMGAMEADGNVLDVLNGAGGDPLTLVVSAATGEISGTVSDSKGPVRSAMVMLMQDGSNDSEATNTDPNGRYLLPHLRPGKYKLLAGSEGAESMMNSRALEEYEEMVATVELHAGDKITQDLAQIPPGKL